MSSVYVCFTQCHHHLVHYLNSHWEDGISDNHLRDMDGIDDEVRIYFKKRQILLLLYLHGIYLIWDTNII